MKSARKFKIAAENSEISQLSPPPDALEYRCALCKLDDVEPLNELGMAGWELRTVLPLPGTTHVMFYLSRPVKV